MYALQFFSLFVNNNYTLIKFLKTASLCDIAQICVFYVTSLPSLSDMPGVERIDRTRQSSSVLEFAQWREAKKEFAERETKSGGKREGVELSSRTARAAFWKYIRAKYFGQTHRVVEQRLACAPRKTHRKNRITSALARNIKNIR